MIMNILLHLKIVQNNSFFFFVVFPPQKVKFMDVCLLHYVDAAYSFEKTHPKPKPKLICTICKKGVFQKAVR